jgi:hypothetical protein
MSRQLRNSAISYFRVTYGQPPKLWKACDLMQLSIVCQLHNERGARYIAKYFQNGPIGRGRTAKKSSR